MTKLTDVSKLDFDSIKDNLKLWMSAQEEFTDFSFEGSGIATLLDVLAYNTHMNALIAHMNMNETFLQTAKARANIVALGNALGYVPRSTTASQALVSLKVIGTDISPSGITVQRGFTFTGNINSKTYTYTVLEPVSASKQTDQLFDQNKIEYYYQLNDVVAYEGELITQRYRVDALVERQAIEIYSTKIDTSTLTVRVYDTSTSSTYQDYVQYSSIEDVTSTSPVYFLRENPYGNYEIYFGDNFIGKMLSPSNVIEIQFIDTNGKAANDIRQLTAANPISGLTNITTTMEEPLTFGGKDRETNESIRYNSRVSYATQNRGVTAADYKALLLQQFTNLKDVAVWGGEDATPPVYGKVFIAAALFSQRLASETLKEEIKKWIQYRNVGSIKVEVVDAQYTYIECECEFKFNPRLSKLGIGECENVIKNSILDYSDTELGKFDGIMRQSRLLTKIDQSDPGITSSIIRTKAYKKFSPDPFSEPSYKIQFPVPIYRSTTAENVVETSVFFLGGRRMKLLDVVGTEEDIRPLVVFDILLDKKVDYYGYVGYVDMDNGLVVIENIRFDNAKEVEVIVRPNTYDITPRHQQLLSILPGDITVIGSEDTVDKYSVKGLNDYNASTRH